MQQQNHSRSGLSARFSHAASRSATLVGSPRAFLLAVFIIVAWGVSGPYFHFSDTWQLVINTGTTIITFLMVFLIQNTQNRDARAIHLKLDEVIRAMRAAHNELIDIENLSDAELDELTKYYERIRAEFDARHQRKNKLKSAV
jgi:low affinity Fe/Cu permease